MHEGRRYQVTTVLDSQELARLLTDCAWTGCTAFRHQGFLFLNDSTSGDGAQEFAVVRERDGTQVESWTVGWMTRESLLAHLQLLLLGPNAEYGRPDVVLDETHRHADCRLCA